ncbi:SAM domain-containing protein [Reticulomyxa filosa]|uniref:SAM domain-containing protein n=1 Tax=Reticulomyxa filosa TaxID=46433 RepID=X6LGB4_RETFI|nr:SAM domain-containing protein [Reticulomyxa filosa]|eukprot:ETN99769.1 SAM domain-containing protein [Reticulomyxa filosa]
MQLYELLPGAVHCPMKEGGDFPYLSNHQEFTMLVQVHLRRNGLYQHEHKAYFEIPPLPLQRGGHPLVSRPDVEVGVQLPLSSIKHDAHNNNNNNNNNMSSEPDVQRIGYFDVESSFDLEKKHLFEDTEEKERKYEERKEKVQNVRPSPFMKDHSSGRGKKDKEDEDEASSDEFDYTLKVQEIEEAKKRQLPRNLSRKPSIVSVEVLDQLSNGLSSVPEMTFGDRTEQAVEEEKEEEEEERGPKSVFFAITLPGHQRGHA